jgi:hypothetical protein
MSAWIVSKAHIDVMVSAALAAKDWGDFSFYHDNERIVVTSDNADEIGQMLWEENHKSVNARYRENTKTPKYTFRPVEVPSPGEVAKGIGCYEYQSCEHDGWETSAAKAFCTELEGVQIVRLPEYESAPWGWDEKNVTRVR